MPRIIAGLYPKHWIIIVSIAVVGGGTDAFTGWPASVAQLLGGIFGLLLFGYIAALAIVYGVGDGIGAAEGKA